MKVTYNVLFLMNHDPGLFTSICTKVAQQSCLTRYLNKLSAAFDDAAPPPAHAEAAAVANLKSLLEAAGVVPAEHYEHIALSKALRTKSAWSHCSRARRIVKSNCHQRQGSSFAFGCFPRARRGCCFERSGERLCCCGHGPSQGLPRTCYEADFQKCGSPKGPEPKNTT